MRSAGERGCLALATSTSSPACSSNSRFRDCVFCVEEKPLAVGVCGCVEEVALLDGLKLDGRIGLGLPRLLLFGSIR